MLVLVAVVVVVLILFLAYKKLPQLGRQAGEGLNQLGGSARETLDERVDMKGIGESAAEGVREFKEALARPAHEEAERSPQTPVMSSGDCETQNV